MMGLPKVKVYEVKNMEKKWYQSKTIQGIVVAVLGGLIFTFADGAQGF